jgi:hypothetical protein
VMLNKDIGFVTLITNIHKVLAGTECT